MDDLISRQAAIDAINSGMLTDDDTQFECPSECNSMLEWAVNAVKELPTAEPSVVTMKLNADPEEVKKLIKRSMTLMPTAEKRSRWTGRLDNDWAGGGAWVCSECGHGYAFGAYHEAFEFNYCPNCGARMGESDDHE